MPDRLAPNTSGVVFHRAGTADNVDPATAKPLPPANAALAVSDTSGTAPTTYAIKCRPSTRLLPLAAAALLAGSMMPLHSLPRFRGGNKYRGANSANTGETPVSRRKVKGCHRNRPCPKCGRKLKRCECGKGGGNV